MFKLRQYELILPMELRYLQGCSMVTRVSTLKSAKENYSENKLYASQLDTRPEHFGSVFYVSRIQGSRNKTLYCRVAFLLKYSWPMGFRHGFQHGFRRLTG